MGLKDLFLLSDDQLIREVARGDVAAFDRLFDRYAAGVLGYLRRMLGRHRADLAEDLSQVVWEKLALNAKSYNGKGFKGWLFTIVRYTAIDEIRKRKTWREESIEDESVLEGATTESGFFNVEEFLVKQSEHAELKRRIDALPDRQRVALVAWLEGDKSQKELASELGVTVKALELLLVRAKQNLTKASTQKSDDEGEMGDAVGANPSGRLKKG